MSNNISPNQEIWCVPDFLLHTRTLQDLQAANPVTACLYSVKESQSTSDAHEGDMTNPLALAVLVLLATSGGRPQVPVPWPASTESPSETIERLWIKASAGELLTPHGWQSACGLFTKTLPTSKGGIRVMSNVWGQARPLRHANDKTESDTHRAQVLVQCEYLGTIDSALRFSPAPKSEEPMLGEVYNLALTSTPVRTYKADGKTLESEKAGWLGWRIADSLSSPFCTVNAAIRYVLERRAETKEPVMKDNAHKTLAALMQLH